MKYRVGAEKGEGDIRGMCTVKCWIIIRRVKKLNGNEVFFTKNMYICRYMSIYLWKLIESYMILYQ